MLAYLQVLVGGLIEIVVAVCVGIFINVSLSFVLPAGK